MNRGSDDIDSPEWNGVGEVGLRRYITCLVAVWLLIAVALGAFLALAVTAA